MLFVVNGELKMGKGKICAQVGHAVIGAYIQMEEEARYDERAKGRLSNWETWGTPKIVVRCESEKEMMNIKKRLEELDIGINTYLVQDAGHTQIKAGSRTVLGIGPAFPEEIDPITQHLKLL
jgi:peptidyl-tRNA hydrolase